VELRRELAYLRLEMGDRAEAEKEFETVVARAPEDLLSAAQLGFLRLNRGDAAGADPLLQKVLAGGDDDLADRVRTALHMPQTLRRRPEEPRAKVSTAARELAEKSLEKGYLKDALKYLETAHENDPLDFKVMLKLGWTYNVLKDDQQAVRWFNLARRSPDRSTASEASRAYHNLQPGLERFRTTVWRSRCSRRAGMTRSPTRRPRRSCGFRTGSSARMHPRASSATREARWRWRASGRSIFQSAAWFSVGSRHGHVARRHELVRSGRVPEIPADRIGARPRGAGLSRGLSYAKGFGGLLARGAHGAFAETNDDGVFVSRFANDTLLYSQNRAGYTLRAAEAAAGLHAQFYWNCNATVDSRGEYWANYVETGPGVRFRFEGLPASLLFSVNAVRGAYLLNEGTRAARTSTMCGWGSGMHSAGRWLSGIICAWPLLAGGTFSFHVMGDDPGSWPAVLSSVGLVLNASAGAGVVVAPGGTSASAAEWTARVERGAILVLEGESPLAAAFGFRASAKRASWSAALRICARPSCASSGRRRWGFRFSISRKMHACSRANDGTARR